MTTAGEWKRLLRRLTGMTENDVNDVGVYWLNEGRVKILKKISSYITEEIYEANTIADKQDYALPIRCHKIEDISVLVGTVRYTPKLITNIRQWYQLTSQNTVKSTIPIAVYIDKNKMSFFPIPSSTGNQIKAIFSAIEPDLLEEDVVGGTINVTNGSNTVSGVGTNFLANYVGWHIKLPDGYWYEVAQVASDSSLQLSKLYEGTTANNASYRLGQVSLIPEEGQILPVYYAAMHQFLTLEKPEKAALYRGLFRDGLAELEENYSSKVKPTLVTGSEKNLTMKNPQDYPEIPNV